MTDVIGKVTFDACGVLVIDLCDSLLMCGSLLINVLLYAVDVCSVFDVMGDMSVVLG